MVARAEARAHLRSGRRTISRGRWRPSKGSRLRDVSRYRLNWLGRARQVEQDLVLTLLEILFAHELESVAERGDRRLQRALDVAALQPQAVDFTLDVFE